MIKKQYTEEFKEQLLKECREVGNASLVACRRNISSNTIHGWIRSIRKRGSVKPLPRNDEKRILEIEKRLEDVSRENNILKKLLGEKGLELAVLRELRDKVNPR